MGRLVIAVTVVSVGTLLGFGNPSRLHAAGSAHAPTISISDVVYRRGSGTVDLHVRLCLSNGPLALLSVTERRAVRGVQKATSTWSDPTGVDLTRVYAYACASAYQIAWALKPRLVGPGTYTATIRVRDGYGTWSRPISFSVSSP
jgi:hypothetical protein